MKDWPVEMERVAQQKSAEHQHMPSGSATILKNTSELSIPNAYRRTLGNASSRTVGLCRNGI